MRNEESPFDSTKTDKSLGEEKTPLKPKPKNKNTKNI